MNMMQPMTPVDVAKLSAGILNVNNLSKENIDKTNLILFRMLEEIDKETLKASLSGSGIIT